MSRKDMTVV